MFSRYDADRVLRRWIRRVAVTALIVMPLTRSLANMGATYVVRNESHIVCPRAAVPIAFVAQPYSVAALARSPEAVDELIERLEESIDRKSWSCVGGAGTVEYFPLTQHLVVYHDEPHQLQVKQILANLSADRDNLSR